MSDESRPLTAEEEADFREALTDLDDCDDISFVIENAPRLLATLDAEREAHANLREAALRCREAQRNYLRVMGECGVGEVDDALRYAEAAEVALDALLAPPTAAAQRDNTPAPGAEEAPDAR